MAQRRYVILEHNWPAVHWDLLLDVGAVLRAWRLWEEPAVGVTMRAEINADHRRIYLDYEGEVSGGRGVVRRWDAGVYEVVAVVGDQAEGVEQPAGGDDTGVMPCPKELVVHLWGQRWQVRCRLWRVEGGEVGEYRAAFTAWTEAVPQLQPACGPPP
ncbi:MAG: DNA polymerase ligase N-terminal domain-containing protein [Thermogemmata sp.]|jgi:hypothetical protein|uniref:DNA ligase D 3'-phosphoesterase domain-containing protein n=1 Tax=Thermogemmata fonticola TaxID=2755323 RepID=A0A7V9AAN5_9BACT|nr:DNA polymerase ligase N-terminal domain-containing protein [Thermogemmata fonticola]MBA2225321.1 hypothetical protein [Thermogemmata fonticola]MCX8139632.1 hypothetical protein [Gemmataceae bacterium]